VSAAATTLWARALAQELVRCGVREVALAPGSRSTPLVLAMERQERLKLRVHLDERSAAFFALGVGKASGRPAAVLTTSGTATANLLPAVVEAARSETPLVVLTADRPPRLRDADANQAIPQTGLFADFVRLAFDLAPPVLGGPELRHLRGQVCRAVAEARGAPAGPVHLNVPFDKPLEPYEGPELEAFQAEHPLAAAGRPDGAPWVRVHRGARRLDEEELHGLAAALRAPGGQAGVRGVVVAGPAPGGGGLRTGSAAAHFAAATGWPLLADPLSGGRFGTGGSGGGEATAVAGYDLFLRDAAVRAALAPDVVLRVGASPSSAALLTWLEHHQGTEQVLLDAGGRWKDHLAIAARALEVDPADTLPRLAELLGGVGEEAWGQRWRAADEAARSVLEEDPAEAEPHEAQVLAAVVEAAGDGQILFVSNSMPIRDLDGFAPPRDTTLRVLGNRGASGIDGIVSTAFGVATQGPVVCVLGDLAFFHDQNGLLWSRERDLPVLFVLVDNDGGSIFRMLPIAGEADHEDAFTEYFTTPHGMEFKHAAALQGLPLEDLQVTEVRDTVAAYLGGPETRILRVRTDSEASHAARRRVAAEVARRVRAALA